MVIFQYEQICYICYCISKSNNTLNFFTIKVFFTFFNKYDLQVFPSEYKWHYSLKVK